MDKENPEQEILSEKQKRILDVNKFLQYRGLNVVDLNSNKTEEIITDLVEFDDSHKISNVSINEIEELSKRIIDVRGVKSPLYFTLDESKCLSLFKEPRNKMRILSSALYAYLEDYGINAEVIVENQINYLENQRMRVAESLKSKGISDKEAIFVSRIALMQNDASIYTDETLTDDLIQTLLKDYRESTLFPEIDKYVLLCKKANNEEDYNDKFKLLIENNTRYLYSWLYRFVNSSLAFYSHSE